MATHASADKAARQAEKRNAINQAGRARFRTSVKTLRTAIVTLKGKKDEAKTTLIPMLSEVQRTLMKAASKNLIKRATASRYIARLSTAVHRAIQ